MIRNGMRLRGGLDRRVVIGVVNQETGQVRGGQQGEGELGAQVGCSVSICVICSSDMLKSFDPRCTTSPGLEGEQDGAHKWGLDEPMPIIVHRNYSRIPSDNDVGRIVFTHKVNTGEQSYFDGHPCGEGFSHLSGGNAFNRLRYDTEN